ncbi:hypothetical protein [Streptomyces lasiicapitis]|uniref:hypothetical protein n=1 Tax=Streptomyces lasiicapitis TaxID=1923961 RepID=UPI001666328F|nr:hypothetical protein [Streptomyces lasiicapitis]
MSDPNPRQPPAGSNGSSPGSGRLVGTELEAAKDMVRRVMALYSEQLAQERRAPQGPEPAHLQELTDQQRACVADLKRLSAAEADEAARIAAAYAARYRELTRS